MADPEEQNAGETDESPASPPDPSPPTEQEAENTDARHLTAEPDPPQPPGERPGPHNAGDAPSETAAGTENAPDGPRTTENGEPAGAPASAPMSAEPQARREPRLSLEPFLSPSIFKRRRRRFHWLWIFFAFNTAALAGLLLYVLGVGLHGGKPSAPEPTETAPATAPKAGQPRRSPPTPPMPEAVSWQTVEETYAAKRYGPAMTQCIQLLEAAKGNPRDELMRDYLRFRIAQCQRNLGRRRDARNTLVGLVDSRSPIVRGSALLEMASLDAAENQYLSARTRAYRAIALLGAADETGPLQDACDFLIAEALTRKALAFFNDEENLPPSRLPEQDPFAAVESEQAVRAMVLAGVERLRYATFAPKVHLARGKQADRGPRWTVTSTGAPLEELLCRVAGAADLTIDWQAVDPRTRNRPLTLCLSNATDHRAIEVACGATGLVARLAGADVSIHDPRALATSDRLQDLLVKEAISLWRRLFLRESDGKRLVYGHFALGILYEHAGDNAGALAEYRLLTQRHATSALAPHALLRCATVRIALHDYTGAREDLLALLDRHPNFPDADVVYLRLGQTAMAAGLLDEAVITFKRLYYYELSQSSKIGAALGAGNCYATLGKPKAAAEWLTRYVNLAQQAGQTDEQTTRAGYLLAKSLREDGQSEEARKRLLLLLEADLKEPLQTEALLELARTLTDQDNFPAAFAVLQRIDTAKVPPPLADKTVLLQAQTLRRIYLPGRAVRLLKNRQAEATTPRTAALMTVELARCYADTGDLERARGLLTEALPKLGHDPPANEVTLELARTCLETDQAAQAIGLCRELLIRDVPVTVRRRAVSTLGAAYAHKRDHDRAVVALTGEVPVPEGATHP